MSTLVRSIVCGIAAALATATLGAATLAPATAYAAENRVAVRYSDLDLSTAKGQAALHRRLLDAARMACEGDGEHTGSRIAAGNCRADADKQVEANFQKLLAAKGGGTARLAPQ